MATNNAQPITVKTSVEFKNPNTYGITTEQSEEGTIVIPACVIKNGAASKCANVEDMTILAKSEDDWMIATWHLPGTFLEVKSSTNITVSVINNIDVMNDLNDDRRDFLSGLSTDGGPIVLRIQGGAKASSWLLGGRGSASFDCLVEMDDVKNSTVPPTVKCNFNVMNMIPVEGIVIPV